MNSSRPTADQHAPMVFVPVGHQVSSTSKRDVNMECTLSLKAISVLSIVFGIALIFAGPFLNRSPFGVGVGIGGGILYIISGSLGLASANGEKKELFVFSIVFECLSMMSSVCLVIVSFGAEPIVPSISILAIANSVTHIVLASLALKDDGIQPTAPPAYSLLPQGHPHSVYYGNQFSVPASSMQAAQSIPCPPVATGYFVQSPDYKQAEK